MIYKTNKKNQNLINGRNGVSFDETPKGLLFLKI